MSDNPLRMKRFGPVTLYVEDARGEAERLSELMGMDIAYVPEKEEEPVYGIEAEDVLFILDSRDDASL